MTYTIPKDPIILYSYINMQLRDSYTSLQEFCDANDLDRGEIEKTLAEAGFTYNEEVNQFR